MTRTMNSLVFILCAILISQATAIPSGPELLMSTKVVGATVVHVRAPCQCSPGAQPSSRPTTPPPSTTIQTTTAGGPGSGSGEYPSGTGNCVRCAVENFELVNQYRIDNGRMPLKLNEKMSGEAADYSEVMYRTRIFKHSDLPYWENIVYASGHYNWPTVAQGFFDQWRRSPGHNANMLLATHKCMGVGIYGDNRTQYGTQVFTNSC